MPTVSVILPAYNVAAYIEESIASILAQTFNDFEIVVVDDGSTDDTAAIVERYAAHEARIRLVRQPNGGISAARNQAMRHASGEIMATIDSDDLWEPEFLEAQVSILDANGEIDLVTTNALYLGSRLDGQAVRPYPDPRPAPDLAQILTDENSVFTMTVFRRRVFETIGGFDEQFRTNEDYEFWVRAALAGFRFARNDRPLARYRRRDDSLSSNEVRMLHGVLKVNRKLRALLADRPEALALLDSKTAYYEAALLVAEARAALATGDRAAIQESLTALHARRGGALLGAARLLARWTPGLLTRAYHLRRARLEAHA